MISFRKIALLPAVVLALAATGCSAQNTQDMQSNEVINNIKERRSVRKYTTEVPSHELLEQVAEAGTYAASAMGRQNVKILVVTNKELRDKISSLNAQVIGREGMDPFYGAPGVIIAIAPKDSPTAVEDGVLALDNMMLAAEALGLSTCYIHRAMPVFDSEEGQKIISDLGIEGEWQGIGNIIIGYADGEKPVAAERKADRVYFVE